MSDIDFQNGFIAGMATRGLTKSIIQDPALAFLITRGVRDTVSLLGTLTITEVVSEPELEEWPQAFVPYMYDAEPTETINLMQMTVTDTATVFLY